MRTLKLCVLGLLLFSATRAAATTIDMTWDLRLQEGGSDSASLGADIEFTRPLLAGVLLIDFAEVDSTTMSLSIRSSPGSFSFGVDANTNDFMQFDFPDLPASIVDFSAITLNWSSFPNLTFTPTSVRLDHTAFFHSINTSPNTYLITTPEPSTAILLSFGLAGLAFHGRRRRV